MRGRNSIHGEKGSAAAPNKARENVLKKLRQEGCCLCGMSKYVEVGTLVPQQWSYMLLHA